MAVTNTVKPVVLVFCLLLQNTVNGFVAPVNRASVIDKSTCNAAKSLTSLEDHSPAKNGHSDSPVVNGCAIGRLSLTALVPSALVLFTALPADAAGTVPNALFAYAHYLTILLATGALVAERTLVKPGMTDEEEDTLVLIDLVYGISAFFLIVSGYYRVTEFGKGIEYYIHEIPFWLKMSFVGIWGGLSLFPTITFIKRSIARRSSESIAPVSEKLAARLKTVMNAEISAMLSIPLLATFMSRGVLYSDDFPLPAGIALVVLTTAGSSFVYGKQALTWSENVGSKVAEETE